MGTQRAAVGLGLGVSSHVTNKLIFLVTFVAAERTVPLEDALVASLTFLSLRAGPEGLGTASAGVLLLSGVARHVKLIPRVPFEAFTAEFATVFLQIFLQMLIFYMNRKLLDHHATDVTRFLFRLMTSSDVFL